MAVLAALCYANTITHGFVFDDFNVVVRNPLVIDSEAGPGVIFTAHYWQHISASGNLYRPLTILSYRLNHAIDGPDPMGYHLVNVILHAFCSSLVLSLAWRLRFSSGGALAAGALFAAHPIHTEAVAGVVGRAEIMAACGVIGAWILHLGGRRPRPARTAFICTLFAAGLLSKENAVVLPALVLAGDVTRVRRGETTWRETLPLTWALLAAATVWLWVRWMVLPGAEAGTLSDPAFAGIPAHYRILTALWVMAKYFGLLIAPLTLSADYSHAQVVAVTTLLSPGVLIGGAGLLILAAGSVVGISARGPGEGPRSSVGLAGVIFLVTIAPVSNIPFSIGTSMAERLLYLPSLALCLGLPALWSCIRRRSSSVAASRAGGILAVILVVLYGARTIERNRDWSDQLTLFTATVEASPLSARAHYNLGTALEDAGRDGTALAEYRIATRIDPRDPKPLRNAALVLARRQTPEADLEAAALLERAASLAPELPGVLSDLGVILMRLGRPVDAEAALREALLHHPDAHDPLYNLGTLLLARGMPADAAVVLARAVRVAPSDADGRYQLGLAYMGSGRHADAVASLREALANDPALVDAHVWMARAFLSLERREEAAAAAARARAHGLVLPPDLRHLAD